MKSMDDDGTSRKSSINLFPAKLTKSGSLKSNSGALGKMARKQEITKSDNKRELFSLSSSTSTDLSNEQENGGIVLSMKKLGKTFQNSWNSLSKSFS
jgi:hypothetical protein